MAVDKTRDQKIDILRNRFESFRAATRDAEQRPTREQQSNQHDHRERRHGRERRPRLKI